VRVGTAEAALLVCGPMRRFIAPQCTCRTHMSIQSYAPPGMGGPLNGGPRGPKPFFFPGPTGWESMPIRGGCEEA